MTTPPNPQAPQGQDINVNPNWKPILDVLPDDFHHLVLPTLKDWDTGVQTKLQEVRSEYEPYKEFATNGVKAEDLEAAMGIAQALRDDPEEFVKQAVEHFGLTKFQQKQLEQQIEDSQFVDLNDEGATMEDLRKDPRFKPFFEKQEELVSWKQQQEQEQEEAEEAEELDNYMKSLHEKHGDFNDDFVYALIANDVDGDAAVQQFNEIVNQAALAIGNNPGQQQQQNTPPPVVMGQGGGTGSGMPDKATKMGDLKPNAVRDLVQQMLENSNNPQP